MLAPALADQLRNESPAYAAAIESQGQWSGQLEATVEDDFEHSRSVTHWFVHNATQRTELVFPNGQKPSALLHHPVVVSGAGTSRIVSADSIHAQAVAAAPAATCDSTGTENVAVIIANQPNGGATYPDPTFATSAYWQQQYFGPSSPSTNNYWQEASFGSTSASGTILGPYTLNSNYSCNLSTMDAMATSAINSAKAANIDLSTYNRFAVVYPVSSCSFGGLGDVGCRAADSLINHPYSISWIPVLSYYSTSQVIWGVVTHELGHNLGLHHSSSLSFGSLPLGAIDYTDPYPSGGTAGAGIGIRTEYGDPYTVMGGGSYTCNAQYTAFNKSEYLSWMDRTADTAEITTTGGTFKVVPYENSSGIRALRVLRDPLTSSWIWLEYRQALGTYDSSLSTCVSSSNILTGANVYYESPYSEDGHLYLLDMTAATSPNSFNDGALAAGQTWSDPYSLLTLGTTSADGTGMTVSASYDAPCAALQLSSGTFTTAGGSGTVTVTAPGTCSWKATTAAGWISITSGASGTGNGTVSFTVASNAGSFQRNGYLTVQRQSLPIAQAGSSTFISSLNPTIQQGATFNVPISFSDPAGVSDIGNVTISFQSEKCQVYGQQLGQPGPTTWYFFLLDPSTGTYSSSISPGQSTSALNANCTLDGSTTTVSTVGNTANVSLGVTFANTFAGSHRVTASACAGSGASTCTSDIAIGTWQVPGATSVAAAISRPVRPSRSGVTTAGAAANILPLRIKSLRAMNSATLSVSARRASSNGLKGQGFSRAAASRSRRGFSR